MQTCPLTLLYSVITSTLNIFGEKLGFVSQNGIDRFAFVPSCNQGELLLTPTNNNFKTSNWIKTKPGRIQFWQLPTSYGKYRPLWVP